MLSARPNWRSNCEWFAFASFACALTFFLGRVSSRLTTWRHVSSCRTDSRTCFHLRCDLLQARFVAWWIHPELCQWLRKREDSGRLGKTREDSKTLRQLKDRQWQVGESKSEKNSFEFELPALDSWPCQFVAFCCNSRFPSPAVIALASFLFPKAPIQSYLVSAILRMHIGIHWPYHHAVRLVSRSFAEVMAGGQSSKFFPYLRRSAFGISILPALLHRTGQATSGRPGLSDFGLRAWSKVWNSSMPLWKSLIYIFWYLEWFSLSILLA